MSYTEISKVRAKAKVKLLAFAVFGVVIIGLVAEWMYATQPLAETVLIYGGENRSTEPVSLVVVEEVVEPEVVVEEIVVEENAEAKAENNEAKNEASAQPDEDALKEFFAYTDDIKENMEKLEPTETVLDKIKLPEEVSAPVEEKPAENVAEENKTEEKAEAAEQEKPAEAEENKAGAPSIEEKAEEKPAENAPENKAEEVNETQIEATEQAVENDAPEAAGENKPEGEANEEKASENAESQDENAPVMLIPGMTAQPSEEAKSE